MVSVILPPEQPVSCCTITPVAIVSVIPAVSHLICLRQDVASHFPHGLPIMLHFRRELLHDMPLMLHMLRGGLVPDHGNFAGRSCAMEMEVEVRSLTGRADRIVVQKDQTVGGLRRHVQAKWQSQYVLRLFLRVRPLRFSITMIFGQMAPLIGLHCYLVQGVQASDKTPLSDAAINAGEFLVRTPCQWIVIPSGM